MKTLNLYCGIGGNRKLWKNVEVTAIENNPEIAKVYQTFFPNDKVIVCDAHDFLLQHFKEYEFIWSSPPCPTHSQIRQNQRVINGDCEPVYPDMRLYQEIILLKHNFNGKWAVENTVSYYAPLIQPQKVGGHYFWSNFVIAPKQFERRGIVDHSGIKAKPATVQDLQKTRFNLDAVDITDKRQLLRNCVEPEVGLHVFNSAFKKVQEVLL
ncbi:MAG: DNA cytosine methyltransferase [Candidatus Bathyarchaeia archaeon]|jgi:DNA (cytosine-5)-methyltransferase 1